ncbi:tyrosine-type recombinase/integrase [Brevundimonas sp.]|jgi:integrase|uniref:tyrosine-type recombinase/integrase n=1 Tax=Brevundimonas sp. TaxID=1871086 RepID=UPI0028ACA47A|nr:tyrosine-type recombinase/integrase [Brevundimonas sp.]
MANIRKVKQRPRQDGSVKVSWRATWTGHDGARQSKNFDLKGDAKVWLNSVSAGLVGGSSSMTLEQLAEAHIANFHGLVRAGARRSGTVDNYQSILDTHVRPHKIAKTKLSALRTPDFQSFLDDVVQAGGSINLARQIRGCFVTWCRFGARRGWLLANLAQACAVEGDRENAESEPFELPPKEHLSALMKAATESENAERDTAIIRILMFGGLRISEALGLADEAVIVKTTGGRLKVRERLDRTHQTLDPPKTGKGKRDVPIGQAAALAIRSWRLKRGPSRPFHHVNGRRERSLVAGRLFPNPKTGDGVWSYEDFIRDGWMPLMRSAGLVLMLPDSKGKNRPHAAFKPHMLRHVAVSLWLAQAPQPKPKKVQELVGHATLKMTMDTYGHLWRDEEEDDAIAQASERLIS